jgi:cytochrome c-type biogenesis protein CcmH/NrfF
LFGYTTLILRPSLGLPIRSFDLALWLIPPMMILGGAVLITTALLRQKEEEKWEKV